MSAKLPNLSREFLIEVALGRVPGYSIRTKFGRNAAVVASVVPITIGGIYRTPPTATALEVLSDNAGDAAAGAGAQSVSFNCITDWDTRETQTVAMNGLTAVPVPTDSLRVDSFQVAASGTYAAAGTPSQLGTITLREAGGGATWGQLATIATTFGAARSQIGCFSVERGKTAFILNKLVTPETTKAITSYTMARSGADIVAAPFTPLTLLKEFDGISESLSFRPAAPNETVHGPADVFSFAKGTATSSSVSVRLTILLVDTDLL